MSAIYENERSNPQLDSEALRTFVAVARHGNVTRAARDLHRTQSAISVQIKQLERNLGVSLFDRQARGVTLTAAGETLLPAAHEIIGTLDRTAAAFVQAPITGTVRVGIASDYGVDFLAAILGDFSSQHPDVEVYIHCGFSPDIPLALQRGELDLAVSACEHTALDAEVLAVERSVWVTREGHVPGRDQPLALALFDRSCWWRDAAMRALAEAGRAYRIAYTSESVEGVKAAVMSGLAVAMLAQSTVDPGMAVLDGAAGLPALPRSCLVLAVGEAGGSPAVEAMARAIRAGFARLPAPGT